MSRFIDKLKQVSQAMSQPMGFRTAKSVSSKSKMLLIASLSQTDVDSLSDEVPGADAGLLRISQLGSGATSLQKICQAMPDIPWGGWLEVGGQEGTRQMLKVGYDFVQTVKEALTGLERVAVPPEDILMALTEGGMPCTVQELLARFRRFVEERTEGQDPNKVRIVVEW